MTLLDPLFGLRGSQVVLEPLQSAHFSALLSAATRDRSTFALTHVPSNEVELTSYLETALSEREQGVGYPFVVTDITSARIVGSTRFCNIQRWSQRPPEDWDVAEIGFTWLTPSVQRSGLNREMKWLMLDHAFTQRHARRVFLKTDARNIRSREAIAGIGASFEGVLRNFGPAADGPVRDVAMFAIIDRDWPALSERLRRRIRMAAEPGLVR